MTPADELPGGRRRAVAIAYHVLGSVTDAEDVAQEAAESWLRTDPATIDDPEAWVAVVATRRAIDRLRARERRRETYVGPWLPEPRVRLRDRDTDPALATETADEVSYALLVVLDQLTPEQRVAFVLHDVFGEPFERVGQVLGRTPAAARQLASRARRRVHDAEPVDDTDSRRWVVADAFLEACRGGDHDRLLAVLAPDVELVSDGGGRVSAALNVVMGADRVARLILGLLRQATVEVAIVPVSVGRDPGAWLAAGDDVTVVALEVRADRVAVVRAIRNPSKIAHVPDLRTPDP